MAGTNTFARCFGGQLMQDGAKRLSARVLARSIPEPNSGCWLFEGYTTRFGYGVVGAGRKSRTALAHRVVYQGECGVIPAGMCVCHRCDNPSCVNPEHLFLGTQADNIKDMGAKNRRVSLPKDSNPSAKATPEQAQAIRSAFLSANGRRFYGGAALGRQFGLSQTQVSRIARGENWR